MFTRMPQASLRPCLEPLLTPLEPRRLFTTGFDAVTLDSLYDFTRDVPAVLSSEEAALFGYGTNVAVLGDINGDLIHDFAVSAPGIKPDPLGRYDAPGPGRVFVFSGDDLSLIRTLQDGAVGFGASMLPVGDVDADGVSDLVVGSPNETAGAASDHHGRVLIYSGAGGGLVRSFTGAGPWAELGYSLAPAGDVSGDGRDDLIAGAPGGGPEPSAAGPGQVFVFSLTDGATIRVLTGVNVGDRFGHAVAGGGNVEDLDRPGADAGPDVVVGAPGFDLPDSQDQGRAYVFRATTGEMLATLVLQVAPDSGSQAIVPGARTGSSVALDPHPDVMMVSVGSPGAGAIGDAGVACGIVDVFQDDASAAELFIPFAQYRQVNLADGARLGEALFSISVRPDVRALYAAQPGMTAAPIHYITGHSGAPDITTSVRYGEFARSTAIAGTAGLIVGSFAGGVVRVTFGTQGTYHLSPGATFGVLMPAPSDFPYMPLALRPGAVEPIVDLRGNRLIALGDSGAIIAYLGDLHPANPIADYWFIKDRISAPLTALITAVEGPPLEGQFAIVGILPDDDVLLTSGERSYRLDRGVLRYLGDGLAVSANQAGLTAAIRDETPVVWLPDGTETAFPGYSLPSTQVVSAMGRVLLSRDRDLYVWERGELRPFYTMPQANIAAQISDANAVRARSFEVEPPPPIPGPTGPIIRRTAYLLDADGNIIADISSLDQSPLWTRITLTTSGLLLDLTYDHDVSFKFLPGTADRIHAEASTSSAVAGADRFLVAANLSYGMGLYRFDAAASPSQLTRLDAGASFVRSAVLYTDVGTARTYLVANVGGTLYWYSNLEGGAFSPPRAITLPAAFPSPPIRGDVSIFTSPDGRLHVAAQTYDGDLILLYQLSATSPDDPASWSGTNLTADHLTPQGLETPDFAGRLATYTTGWGGMNIAGLDEQGDLRVVWWAPGLTLWQSSNLSDISTAEPLAGNAAPYLTSWGGINFAVTDAAGAARVIWWVPAFGGAWRFDGFAAGDDALQPGSLTAYVTPWDGLNVAGLTESGEIASLWWTPSTSEWTYSPITPLGDPSPRFTTPLTSAADAASGALNITALTDDHALARLLWTPATPAWTLDVI